MYVYVSICLRGSTLSPLPPLVLGLGLGTYPVRLLAVILAAIVLTLNMTLTLALTTYPIRLLRATLVSILLTLTLTLPLTLTLTLTTYPVRLLAALLAGTRAAIDDQILRSSEGEAWR